MAGGGRLCCNTSIVFGTSGWGASSTAQRDGAMTDRDPEGLVAPGSRTAARFSHEPLTRSSQLGGKELKLNPQWAGHRFRLLLS